MLTVTTADEEFSAADYGGRPVPKQVSAVPHLLPKKRVDTARLWDASSGKEIRTFDLTMTEDGPPTKMLVKSVVFSADCKRVLMVGPPAPTGPRGPQHAPGHFSFDRVVVWDVASGEKIETAFRPDSRRPTP